MKSMFKLTYVVRTNRLHDFDKGTCFPDNCCYENG